MSEEKHSQDIRQMKFEDVESIIESGDGNQLKIVFETGQFTNINKPKSLHGPSLLMIACQSGYIDCVKILLEYNADINYLNQNDSVLSCACRSGSVELVHFIIASGFKINDEIINNFFKSEYLMQNTEIITILIDYIQDICNGYITFISCASMAGNVAIVRLLLERGANPNIEHYDCIVAASMKGHIEVVKLLLTWGSVDKRPSQDMLVSALIHASRSGHLDIVRYLFECGITDTAALTDALRHAVECNHVQVAEYLIAKGADINTTATNFMNDQYSLLTFACCFDYMSMVHLLLSSGADPNAVAPRGECPLKAALHHPGIVLDAGADPNLQFADGSTALLEAMKPFRVNVHYILTLLLQHGADPNLAHAHTADTPLITAALVGRVDLVRLLLEYGADVTQVNRDGDSVLDMLGRTTAHPVVVELCLQYIDTNRPGNKPLLK